MCQSTAINMVFLLLFEKYLTCTSCIHLEYIGVEEVKNLSETFGC